MKKSKIAAPVVLLALLVCLIGAYVALSAYNDSQSNEEESDSENETFKVCDMSEDSLVTLSYTDEKSELSLVLRDGTWILSDDELYPVDQTLISKMLSALCAVEAKRTVDGTDSAAYGLDEPTLTVTVGDGECEHTFKLGDTNSYNSLKYLECDGKVYMISDTLSSAFDVTKSELFAVKDSFPSEISEDSVTSVAVNDGEGRENIITDSDGISDIVHSLQKYCSFATPKGYALDEAGLAEYGISEDSARIIVNYEHSSAKASFELVFGKNSDGDAFYALPSGDVTYGIDAVGYDELTAYVYHAPSDDSDSVSTEEPDESEDTSNGESSSESGR